MAEPSQIRLFLATSRPPPPGSLPKERLQRLLPGRCGMSLELKEPRTLVEDVNRGAAASTAKDKSPASVVLEMSHHYRFQIHRIKAVSGHHFQLRIGMDWGHVTEFIPAHCSAFAGRLDLEHAHPTEVDANLELSRLLEWIDGRAA